MFRTRISSTVTYNLRVLKGKTSSILHWYGPEYRSPQDDGENSLRRDLALLREYIRSNKKLTSQLAFMKNQRKKRKTDSNLVQDYCFIVSLHRTLKTMDFGVRGVYIFARIWHPPLLSKQAPQRRVSSKAILACLDVTASWLSRAKRVIKLLDKMGPEGTAPDPLVEKRLQSREVTNKGSDLLTFLKQRAIG
jgi:hypothetical protein